ncbi:hypothetical protein [Desulfolutivibrio sulfoxidireducens]|uniref:hypothetical protein n=1 Tax=Desulfolutivibrio sulfoxidireducens TaxID=2773299 RepID=UPI00159D6E58|nr:hypothetical protein [Desulfolutivibrio sulfoxidireducens]QLA14923.1 hypothetical protein GD605_01545 [Desulfolutivibrio sulfoxidireducens]
MKELLLLLGMRGSGLSVLSGCLHRLGVDFGVNIVQSADPATSPGFYNQSFSLAHDMLFRDLRCSWDMIGGLPEDWLQSEAARIAKERILNLFETEFSGSYPCAVADPRLCRFLPLWREICETVGIKPRCILMIRHPHEVAQSLRTTTGAEMLNGHLLWLTHTREAIANLQGFHFFVLSFDELLADPVDSIHYFADTFRIPLETQSTQHIFQLLEYVKPELKHHTVPSHIDDLFKPYEWLYNQLRLSQINALEPVSDFHEDTRAISCTTIGQSLAVQNFPLIGENPACLSSPETNNASAMFDNLLSIIRNHEQDNLDIKIQRQRRLILSDLQQQTFYAQVFFPNDDDGQTRYSSDLSEKYLLLSSEWQELSVFIPSPALLRQHSLRIDPLNHIGMIFISTLRLLDETSDAVLWSANDADGFKSLTTNNRLLVVENDASFIACSTGSDAQIFLPVLPDLPDKPMRLQIWIMFERSLSNLKETWDQNVLQHRQSLQQLSDLEQEHQKYIRELKSTQHSIAEYSSIISTTKEEVESLRQTIHEFQSQAVAREDEVRQALALREAELTAAQVAIAERDADIAAATGQLDALRAEMAALAERAVAREDEVRQALALREAELTAAQVAIAERDADIAAATGQLDALRAEMAALAERAVAREDEVRQALALRENELAAAQVAIAERDAGINAATGQLDALRTEMAALAERAVAREDEVRQALALRENELAAARDAIAERDAGINAATGQLDALRTEIAALQTKDAASQKELAHRENELAAARDAIAERDAGINAATGQLDALRTEIAALQTKDAASQKELAHRESELAAARDAIAERDAGINAATGQLDALRTEIAALQAQAAASQEELAHRETELAAARDAIAERDANIAAATGQLDALRTEIAALQTKDAASQEELAHRESELAAARDAIAERDAGINAATGQLDALRAEIAALQAQAAASQEELAHRESELAAARVAITERDAGINAATGQLDALRTEITALQAQAAASQKELAHRESELGAARDAIAERDADIAAATGQLDALRAEMAALAERAVAREDEVRQALALRETELAAAQVAIAERDADIAAATGQLEALRTEMAALAAAQVAIAERDADIAAATGQLEALRTEMAALAERAVAREDEVRQALALRETELAAAQVAITERDADIAAATGQLDALRTEMAALAECAVAREDEVRQALALREDEVRQALAHRETELAAAQVAIAERDADIAAATRMIKSLQHESVTFQEQIHSQEQALSDSILQHEQEIQNLKACIRERENSTSAALEHINKLQNELSGLQKSSLQYQNELNETRALYDKDIKLATQANRNLHSNNDAMKDLVSEIRRIAQRGIDSVRNVDTQKIFNNYTSMIEDLKDKLAKQENLTRQYFEYLSKEEQKKLNAGQ